MQGEYAADQQPGTGDGQASVEIVHGQGRALQAAAGDQLQGDRGKAGDGGDAHGQQDQAGVLVFDSRRPCGPFPGWLSSSGRAPAAGTATPQVPASEDVLHGITGGDQPGASEADCSGEAQARVGAGQTMESHGASFTRGMACTLDRHRVGRDAQYPAGPGVSLMPPSHGIATLSTLHVPTPTSVELEVFA